MVRTITAVSLLALVTVTSSALSAQRRDRGLVEVSTQAARSGFYFTGALGGAAEQCQFVNPTQECAVLDANGDPLPDNGNSWRDAITKPSGQIRLGGTLSPNVRLGAEFFGWSGDNGPSTERTGGLLANVQLYPSATAGFYIKLGGGFAWNSVNFHDGTDAHENGFMYNGGLGYEFPVSRNVSLGPVVDYYGASYSDISNGDVHERFIFVGLSLTAQTGRRW